MLGSLKLCRCPALRLVLEAELQRFVEGCWCGTAVSNQTFSNPGAG